MALHRDRLFPADAATRDIARRLFASVEKLPIISPHGHTDPRWYAPRMKPFPIRRRLLVKPDHYIFRMLYSQGVPAGGASASPARMAGKVETDSRKIWNLFAAHWHLFRGTPTKAWLEHTLETVFGITDILSAATADSHLRPRSPKS